MRHVSFLMSLIRMFILWRRLSSGFGHFASGLLIANWWRSTFVHFSWETASLDLRLRLMGSLTESSSSAFLARPSLREQGTLPGRSIDVALALRIESSDVAVGVSDTLRIESSEGAVGVSDALRIESSDADGDLERSRSMMISGGDASSRSGDSPSLALEPGESGRMKAAFGDCDDLEGSSLVSVGDLEGSLNLDRTGDCTSSDVAAFVTSMALFEDLGGEVFRTTTELFDTSMALFDAGPVGFRMRRDGRTGADERVRVAVGSGAGFVTVVLSLLLDPDDDFRDQGSGADGFDVCSAFTACRLAAMVSLMLCFALVATDLVVTDLLAAVVVALAGAGAEAVAALSLMRTLR